MKAMRLTVLLMSLLVALAVAAAPSDNSRHDSSTPSHQSAPAVAASSQSHGGGQSGSGRSSAPSAPVVRSSTESHGNNARPTWGGSSQPSRGSGGVQPQPSKGYSPATPVTRDPGNARNNGQPNWGGGSQSGHSSIGTQPQPAKGYLPANPVARDSGKPYGNGQPAWGSGSQSGHGPANNQPRPGNGYQPAPPGGHGPNQPPSGDWGFGRDNSGRGRIVDADRHGRDGGFGRDDQRFIPRSHEDWYIPYHGRYQGIWRYLPAVTQVIIGVDRPAASMPPLGSVIVGSDNTFLGVISRDANDPDSISNPNGRFGSPESPYSIWNTSGRWGDPYDQDTPWNPNATRPPIVYVGHDFWGYVSTNPAVYPRVDPRTLAHAIGVVTYE